MSTESPGSNDKNNFSSPFGGVLAVLVMALA
jgi:hypothetical protein